MCSDAVADFLQPRQRLATTKILHFRLVASLIVFCAFRHWRCCLTVRKQVHCLVNARIEIAGALTLKFFAREGVPGNILKLLGVVAGNQHHPIYSGIPATDALLYGQTGLQCRFEQTSTDHPRSDGKLRQ